MPTNQTRSTERRLEPNIYERIAIDPGEPPRVIGYRVKASWADFETLREPFDDVEAARTFLAECKQARADGQRVSPKTKRDVTIGDVLRDECDRLFTLIAAPTTDAEARTKHRAELKRIEYQIGACTLIDTPLVRASADDWRDWIELRSEAVVPGTVKRELGIVKKLLTVRCRDLNVPITLTADLLPTVRDERNVRLDPRCEKLLFEEYAACENPWIEPSATFALESSARRSELLRLTWDGYDPSTHMVRLQRGKNGTGRYILLSARAEEVIEIASHLASSAHLIDCETDVGDQIFKVTSTTLSQAHDRARKRAAARMRFERDGESEADRRMRAFEMDLARQHLADETTTPEKRRSYEVQLRALTESTPVRRALAKRLEEYRWHDLRHEGISRRVDERWSIPELKAFSGHRDLKSLSRYMHPDEPALVQRLRADEARKRAA